MAESNNLKLKDYFKQAENVIESNLKIFMPCILIFVIVSVFVSQINFSGLVVVDSEAFPGVDTELLNQATNQVALYTVSIVLNILFSLIEIFILLKAKTGLDVVEDKREKGNVLVKIGRLILANIVYIITLSAIISIIGIVIMIVYAISQLVAALALLVLLIPLIMISIFTQIILTCLTFEIIVKNTKVIESYKAVYKNLMKSKTKTLSKILVGMCVQILAITIIVFISATPNNIMLVVGSALQAACMVYFLVYNLIIYMSSEL